MPAAGQPIPSELLDAIRTYVLGSKSFGPGNEAAYTRLLSILPRDEGTYEFIGLVVRGRPAGLADAFGVLLAPRPPEWLLFFTSLEDAVACYVTEPKH